MNRKRKEIKFDKFTTKMQKKLVILFVFVLLAFIGLSIRLILINKESGEKYKKQVLSQQKYESRTIPYKRGDIIDRKGTPLAVSEKVYNVVLDCKVMTDKEKYIEPTIQAMVQCFGIEESEIRKILADNPQSVYNVLKKKLTYDEISPFVAMQNAKETKDVIKGVWFEEEYRRKYPNNSLACDVIGFTSKDNVGTYGLEEFYNETLNGSNGRNYGYLNSDSNLERSTKPAMDGNSLVSTIDANIQNIIEKYILQFNEEHKGKYREEDDGSTNMGVIIMNPNNGEILGMASYPTFDLNKPKDLSQFYTEEELSQMDDTAMAEAWNALWKNYCINSAFEPGSTAKLFTLAAGLETGKITGNESYQCNGFLVVGDKTIRCNNRLGHGPVTVSGSIEQSCNVALMHMASATGKEIFMKYQDMFSFGLKTNIDLAGESRGLLYDVNKMVPSDLAVSSFGQGFTVTMVQMAAAFSSLINGGYYYEPHMVKSIISPDGATVKNIEPRILKQPVSSSTSDKIKEYCNATVAIGTGKKARPAGYTMGGKTGTAQKLPRELRQYVVSFIGYAPADDPQVLIYVVIDEPNEKDQPHASYAIEVVRKIMTEVLRYMNVFMTEEFTEAELEELKTLSQNMIPKKDTVSGNEAVSGNEVPKETEEPDTQEEVPGGEVPEEETPEKPEVRINPETGNAIDPLTGEDLDPETGQPIAGGSSFMD